MGWMKEHRSERPPVWDHANPSAGGRESLRRRLAAPLPAPAPSAKPPRRTDRKKP